MTPTRARGHTSCCAKHIQSARFELVAHIRTFFPKCRGGGNIVITTVIVDDDVDDQHVKGNVYVTSMLVVGCTTANMLLEFAQLFYVDS